MSPEVLYIKKPLIALVKSAVKILIPKNISPRDTKIITKICLRFLNFLIYSNYILIFSNMQKIAFSHIIRQELTRALVFGVGFFTIMILGFVSVAYAANGGIF